MSLGLRRWTAAVRPEEARALRLSFLAFFLLLSAVYALRPVREALGVESGVSALPWLFTGTFVFTLPVIPLYLRLVSSAPRRRIVPYVMHGVVACLLLFHLSLRFDVGRTIAGQVFFVWYSVFNLFVVAAFWSLMAEVFRSEQGRRLFGYIAGGGSAGAIAGPLLAATLVERIGLANLLLVSAALFEGVVVCVLLLRRATTPLAPGERERAPESERIGGSVWAGFTAVVRQPFLRLLSVQMVLTTSAATVLYMLQAQIVSDAASGTEQRLAIFAHIDLYTNIVAALVQLLVTGPMLMRWGAGVPLRIAASLLAVSLLLLARWPTLNMLKAVQALRRAGHYALERPALNLLFTVVGVEEKYKAKGFIDTVVYRGGDAAAAQLFGLLAAAGMGTAALSLAAVPLAAGGWWLAATLSRRHRALERDTQLPLETRPGLRHPAAQERSA